MKLFSMCTKYFFILLSSWCLLSCANKDAQESDDLALKNHLPTTLIDNPNTLSNDSVSSLHTIGNLTFVDTVHDFGRITDGEILSYDFEFENTGKKEIIINEAKASCGCTVPVYPQYPIAPGKKETIKVTFNSQGKKGNNEKGVTIQTNGSPAVYTLIIKAQVE
ncbi:MAG: DUF1573 domain-containing protein [Bacteroidetes bacterium]|nr:DUF1573 domain-containing protein [Bacteroidota bacterium]